MIIHHNALVLVADGRKYLLLRNTGDLRQATLACEGHGEQQNAATGAQGSDRPGRAFASVGGARSALAQTDWHQLEEDRFAAGVADMLGRLAEAGDFAELIVVAPPKCLAELRSSLAPQVASRVVAEIAKDLTKHPIDQIARILEEAGEN